MADNIVGGLFGVDPAALQRQQQAATDAQAYRFANLDNMQQAKYAQFQGGAGLGRAVGGLLGMEDPELAKASMAKKLASQFDITSAAGLRQYAQALAQNGAPDLAQMASKRADEIMATQEQTALRSAQTAQAEAGKVIQIDLGDRIQLVNALTREVIREIPKGLTPGQAAKAAGGGGEGGLATPGPVGKSGAYRDITGQVLGPTEMKPVRQEFETNQRLLKTLNDVSETDVKNAESFVDWTTKAESKALASKTTLDAQSKIAASQLLEQIGQLPPGSASDADMRAAMKSFPGYSDPIALANWVNRTKEKLQFNIGRTSDQFGFKPTVTATAPIEIGKKKETQAQPSKGKTRTLKSGVTVTEE